MSIQDLDLFILAAEPSADKHGFEIAKTLLHNHPHYKIAGVLGPKMRSLPILCTLRMEKLQVMGFIDVLSALPKIIFHFFSLRKKILKLKPKAILCIDYPEFNLRLERSLKKKGYQGKIFHHICPTVWAWAKQRIQIMNQGIDHLFTIFPFEKAYVEGQRFSVSYVGHPLAQLVNSHYYQPLSLDPLKKILAIFPGSRSKEVLRNFPFQAKAAQKLLDQHSNLQLVISYSDERKKRLIEQILSKQKISSYTLCPCRQNYDLMKKAHLAIATSGTITLELALHSTPTVVTFFIQLLDLVIAQKLLKIDLPFFCIVNIICRSPVFAELFGPNLTEKKLDFWAEKTLTDLTYRKELFAKCAELKQSFKKLRPTDEIVKKISSEIR